MTDTGARKKILLADDEQDLVEMLAARLQANGYEVLRAHDGEDAFRIAADARPALIILDLLMPKGDGNAVAERLRTDPATARIPVIFLSGLAEILDVDKNEQAPGGRWILPKPFDAKKLLKLVEKALASR